VADTEGDGDRSVPAAWARKGMLWAAHAEEGPVHTVPLRLIEPGQPNQNVDSEVGRRADNEKRGKQ